MRKPLILLLILFFIIIFQADTWALKKISKHIKQTDGLKYSLIKGKTSSGRINIHLLEIDPLRYDIKLALAKDKIGYSQTLPEMMKNNPQIIAAVNGTFFCTSSQLPISNIMIDGKMVFLNNLFRTNCGITKKNKIFFGIPQIKGSITIEENKSSFYIWGMNRSRKINEIIVYTKEWGKTTETNSVGIEFIVEDNTVTEIKSGNSKIPENGFVISAHGQSKKIADWLAVGSKVKLNFTLTDEWITAHQIFASGPRLLKRGKIVVNEAIKEEKFKGYLLDLHPRTAIGVTKTGKILLVVIDGRTSSSSGVTFYQLAHIMSDLGATEAMGLDGGNSSIMYFDKEIVNSPSAGIIEISNAIITIQQK